MTSTPSIYELKAQFLHSQIRALSALPAAPPGWRDRSAPTEHGDLSDAVLHNVMYKLSLVARKHENVVFSTQALRHVAEQIDALYWEAAVGFEGAPAREEQVLRADTDFRDPRNIVDLPERYPVASGEEVEEEELQRYEELRSRLSRFPALLEASRKKVAYYRKLQELVRPFEKPTENVQPNIVTRDGELASELERTRILAARLAAQVERVKMAEGADADTDTAAVTDEERLKALIEALAQ